MKKLLLIALGALLLAAVSVSAQVNVTYTFNQNNVQAAVYACGDSTCTADAIQTFTGTTQSSTTNSVIEITYPTIQQTPFGYAVYFVSDGFLSIEGKVSASGTTTAAESLQFEQLDNCQAVITDYQVLNTVQANVPLIIKTESALSGDVASAFTRLNNGVDFIPPQFQDFYAADVDLQLTIYNANGQVVHQQTITETIPADGVAFVEFTWTPKKSGDYTAKITTNVVDDQCSSTGPVHEVSKDFTVLQSQPDNACYTLLNNLFVAPDPQQGNTVTAGFNHLSNHVDSNANFISIDTFTSAKVWDPNNNLIYDQSNTLPASGDISSFTGAVFNFIASEVGFYTVQVMGEPASALCTGLTKTTETMKQTFFVEAQGGSQGPTFTLTVNVEDQSNNPLEGATVTVGGRTGTTDSTGSVDITGLVSGVFPYQVSKQGFETNKGTITMPNSDLTITVALKALPAEEEEEMTLRIGVTSIRIPGANSIEAGSAVPIMITFENDGTEDLENMKVVVLLSDLGVRKAIGPMDLDGGERVNKRLILDIPADAEPGRYPVRFTLFADGVKRVVYREVRIV